MEKRIFGRKYNTDTAKLVPLDIIDVDTIVKVVDGCELDKRDYKCPGIDDCGRFDWFYYCTVVHSECDPNMFRC